MFVDTFISRPILASVCSLVIILAGAMAIPTLPIAYYPELAPPTVQVIAFYNGASAEGGQYDALFISNYIDRFVKDELKRVPGVGEVVIFGERKYAMRLWVDPDRLAGRGITADEVINALREQNVQVAVGAIGSAPARPGQT